MIGVPVAAAPELAAYDGHPVTWTAWQRGLVTSMRFHHDMSCQQCGVLAYPDPTCWGLVHRPGRERLVVGVAQGRPVTDGWRPRAPRRELAASRCTACGHVHVIAFADPGWSWSWGGPGSPLPIGVEHRDPPPKLAKPSRPPAPSARPARKQPSSPQERPNVPTASAGTRQAAREALAATLAANRAARR